MLAGAPERTQSDAILEVSRAVRPYVTTLDEAAEVMNSFIADPERNQLSQLGRLRINYRLAIDEPVENQQITVLDLLGATRELIMLAHGATEPDPEQEPRETDRQRFRTVGELMTEELRLALVGIGFGFRFHDLRDEPLGDLIPATLITDAANAAIESHFGPVT